MKSRLVSWATTMSRALLPGEVVKDVDFYDYDAKYMDNKITWMIQPKIKVMMRVRSCVKCRNGLPKPLGVSGLFRWVISSIQTRERFS